MTIFGINISPYAFFQVTLKRPIESAAHPSEAKRPRESNPPLTNGLQKILPTEPLDPHQASKSMPITTPTPPAGAHVAQSGAGAIGPPPSMAVLGAAIHKLPTRSGRYNSILPICFL